MIFENAIQAWRQRCPWREQRHVEQDLILHSMLTLIYSDPIIAEKLAFRGGTCLNKLYLDRPFRYSEDLDFVQIKAEPIGPIAERIKIKLTEIFSDKPQWEAKKGGFKIFFSFLPEDSPYKQKIKIEINTREHLAVKGFVKKKIVLDSLWRSGEADVTTFVLEELLATKLRALYQRKKGRDLFDLWVSQKLEPDYKEVVAIFGAYMKNEGHRVSREQFMENLQNKMQLPQFLNDMAPLIRPGTGYDPKHAWKFVLGKLLSLLA
ncbi:MAG: hypothetical protein ACD_62C00294G0005 [uncultured bacterium]|nr:MAG: hypothetical protein ACD_62C00294G0005 [uncultured bacterium]HLD44662.1 nucleotidyl transferase AbiEii/AbiGii toxin family protein [bacterium]